jgi:hypothetical protein
VYLPVLVIVPPAELSSTVHVTLEFALFATEAEKSAVVPAAKLAVAGLTLTKIGSGVGPGVDDPPAPPQPEEIKSTTAAIDASKASETLECVSMGASVCEYRKQNCSPPAYINPVTFVFLCVIAIFRGVVERKPCFRNPDFRKGNGAATRFRRIPL